jgi:hypothetical protein
MMYGQKTIKSSLWIELFRQASRTIRFCEQSAELCAVRDKKGIYF